MACICGHIEEEHRAGCRECEAEECLCGMYEEEDEVDSSVRDEILDQMAAIPGSEHKLLTQVEGYNVLAYQPDFCPLCLNLVFIPRMIEVPKVKDWTPVERSICPHCGAGIVLVTLTTPRLAIMGADEVEAL